MHTHEKETETSVPQACYGMDVHTHEKENETGTDKRERQKRGVILKKNYLFLRKADALRVGLGASHHVNSRQE